MDNGKVPSSGVSDSWFWSIHSRRDDSTPNNQKPAELQTPLVQGCSLIVHTHAACWEIEHLVALTCPQRFDEGATLCRFKLKSLCY